MRFNLGFVFGSWGHQPTFRISPWGDWCGLIRFRWLGRYSWGLQLKNTAPLFSERYGFEEPLLRLWGFRIVLVKPEGRR